MKKVMKYYFYRTENILNGHYYMGVRSSKDPDTDPYLGSGVRLKAAIEKYGRTAFRKTIVAYFNSMEEAYEYEAIKITKKEVLDPNCYNVQLGGDGGTKGTKMFTNGDKIIRIFPEFVEEYEAQGYYPWKRPHSAETRAKMSISHKGKPGTMKGKHHSEETRRKISEAGKGRKHTPEWIAKVSAKNRGKKRSDEVKAKISASNRGKTFSEESRHKMSESHKGLPVWNKGTKLDYKTVWMNNGQKNARIREENIEQKLSEEWVKGKLKNS